VKRKIHDKCFSIKHLQTKSFYLKRMDEYKMFSTNHYAYTTSSVFNALPSGQVISSDAAFPLPRHMFTTSNVLIDLATWKKFPSFTYVRWLYMQVGATQEITAMMNVMQYLRVIIVTTAASHFDDYF